MQDDSLPDHALCPHPPPPAKRNMPLHAFGRSIRELRARRDLSQDELGYRSRFYPTFKVLMKLSRGLSMPLSEVIAE